MSLYKLLLRAPVWPLPVAMAAIRSYRTLRYLPAKELYVPLRPPPFASLPLARAVAKGTLIYPVSVLTRWRRLVVAGLLWLSGPATTLFSGRAAGSELVLRKLVIMRPADLLLSDRF